MAKEIRKGKIRVSLNLPTEIHMDMRALAFHKNTTMTVIVENALINYINRQKKYLATYRDMR